MLVWAYDLQKMAALSNFHNNNNCQNGPFLRGLLPHKGKAQMACNCSYPTRTLLSLKSFLATESQCLACYLNSQNHICNVFLISAI